MASAYLPLFETNGLTWAGVGTGCYAGICSPSSICFSARLSQLCDSVAHTRSSGREGANDWCKKEQEQCHMRIQLRGGADKYAFPNTRVTCILDPHTFRREGQGATRHLHARDDMYEISGGDIAGGGVKEGGQVGRRSSSTEDYATLALVEEQVEGRDKEEGRDGENQVFGEGRASKLPPTLSELTRTQKGSGLGGITSLTRSIQRACPTTSLRSPSLQSPSPSTLSSRSARRKKGPVLRAARCEHVTTVNGSVVECRKRPCYGPPLSTAVRCSKHQKDGDQDVTNPRCQWGGGGAGGAGGSILPSRVARNWLHTEDRTRSGAAPSAQLTAVGITSMFWRLPSISEPTHSRAFSSRSKHKEMPVPRGASERLRTK